LIQVFIVHFLGELKVCRCCPPGRRASFRSGIVVYRFLSPPDQEHAVARLADVDESAPGVDAELLRAMRARRGGALLNLDRQLLHSPPLARGWNACMGAIRGETQLDGGLRELLILRVAVLNRAPYEFAQHAPVALTEGVPQAQIDAVANWQASPLFDPRTRDALAYADAMTLQVQVPQALFDALRARCSARELVELTAVVAAYNMVSRFLEALQIEIEPPP
jgi:alkylhydroperoxidase family enzyme